MFINRKERSRIRLYCTFGFWCTITITCTIAWSLELYTYYTPADTHPEPYNDNSGPFLRLAFALVFFSFTFLYRSLFIKILRILKYFFTLLPIISSCQFKYLFRDLFLCLSGTKSIKSVCLFFPGHTPYTDLVYILNHCIFQRPYAVRLKYCTCPGGFATVYVRTGSREATFSQGKQHPSWTIVIIP